MEVGLRSLLPTLAKAGVVCGLVLSHRPGRPQRILDGIGLEHYWDVIDAGPLDLDVVRETSSIARSFRPDLVHSHDYKTDLIAIWLRCVHRTPIVTTLHGDTGATRSVRLYEWIDRVLAPRYFDAVLTLVPRSGAYHTIFNGVDPDDVYRRGQPPFERGAEPHVRIAVVGRLSPEKGHEVLISALSSLGAQIPWHVFLVGDGPCQSALERRVRDAQLEQHVTFAGYMSNPLPLLASCDILAIPSHTERCPQVALEAMALGKVILASGVGALPYMVEHQRTGWLVRPGDAVAWRDALLQAWQSRDAWLSMGRLARAKVEGMFHIQAVAARHLEIYRRVVGT